MVVEGRIVAKNWLWCVALSLLSLNNVVTLLLAAKLKIFSVP